MQEQNYEDLQTSLTEKLSELVPLVGVPSMRQRVSEKFAELRASGQLDSLTPDEVNLLEDYRMWKTTPDAASRVFHWKRR